MMWVAAFTALALPAPSVILSVRWKYIAKGFWSQAKAPEPAKLPPTRTARAIMCLVPIILTSILRREHDRALLAQDLLANDMTIWALDVAAAGDVIPEHLSLLHLTHQEKIDVIAGKVIIERTCQFLPRHGRSDEMGRDDDHQVRLQLLELLAAEQCAEDRHRADPGKLRDVAPIVGLQQAGDREALAVTQLDRGARLALVYRRDIEAGYGHGSRKVELAHRWREAQIDDAVFQDRGREGQLHTERLGLDGNDRHGTGAPWLYRGHRIFAAGEKRGGIAGERNQVRLGQTADQSFCFQGSQQNIKAATLAGKICQRNAERLSAGQQCACSCKYWQARGAAASRRTWRGYRISACVNKSSRTGCTDPRPAARLPGPPRQHAAQTTYTGGKTPVPTTGHPELATRGADDLEKTDLEHDLLRRSHRHRVHDAAAFGHHALGHLNGALGGHRIGGDATEHDLAVVAANADTAAAGARTDLFLK